MPVVTNAFVCDPLVQIVRATPVHVTFYMDKAGVEPAKQGTKPSE